MTRKTVRLRLGRGHIVLSVPPRVDVLEPVTVPAIADPEAALRHALQHPTGTQSLDHLVTARRPRSVVITISDVTRPVPNRIMLPPVLDILSRHGIRDDQVAILIATGMHRPSAAEEREHMLGPEWVRRCEIIDHRADDASSVRQVADDPPVRINECYLDAGFRIVTGLIEPHFMAGFSGGRKGICPGLADLATVQRFHGFSVMSDPRADSGILDGNPCHQEALRVARLAGCDFLVNVAITHDRRPAGFFCGDLEAAHLAGCHQVGRWSSVRVDSLYDLVVTTGGGYPLDATYYQTVKGMVGALPATHRGSTLVVLSSCDEGVGSAEYTRLMHRWGRDWRGFLETIRRSPEVEKDQWQMQMQTRAVAKLEPARVRLICDGLPPGEQQAMGVEPVIGAGAAAARCQQFVDRYLEDYPGARVAIIPEGPYTMIQTATSHAPVTQTGSSPEAS